MLVGRAQKAPSESTRVTVDFISLGYLDPNETITSLTTPVVALQADAWPGPWPQSLDLTQNPPVLPVDLTPLVVASQIITGTGTLVVLFLRAGTDGNAYSVTFVATGTSGRTKEVRVDVTVRTSSTRALP